MHATRGLHSRIFIPQETEHDPQTLMPNTRNGTEYYWQTRGDHVCVPASEHCVGQTAAAQASVKCTASTSRRSPHHHGVNNSIR
jgi:hypothetical protein